MDRVRDDGGGEGAALLARRLVTQIEDPKQFGVLAEHSRIEARGDLLGVLGDDGRGCRDHGLRRARQQ